MTVFLDANVLFSAALGGSTFKLIFELAEKGRFELVTSEYCYLEAATNLQRKRPASAATLDQLMLEIRRVPHGRPLHLTKAQALLPEKDAPVLAAALTANADCLVTGDRKDFGHLMAHNELGIRVCTPRDFLLSGPPDKTF